MDMINPVLTPHFIVADGPYPGDPLEIWVDWVSGIDAVAGERDGMASWKDDDLVVAGSLVARRIVGLAPDVIEQLKADGGVLVAALASGVISRLFFKASGDQ